jgi:hypothetical protein
VADSGIENPGLSTEQVVALILDRAAATLVVPGVLTLDDLLAQYPASADTAGKYARVSNLFGSVDEIMRCRFDGVAYRWVPQRSDFNMVHPAQGTVQLRPLYTPPVVRAPGTLTGNIVYQTSAENAHVGMRFRTVTGGLGLYTATIAGLVGSNLALLGNKVTDIEYGATGWFAVAG